ncbi:acyl-CoA thioester hydrolase [Zhouia amylolytica]|uniref:Acyl-CoA thioester hydrolase n=1 Tax=Zhouia amylolytica TaxID=376730 RepID=A0A1I6QYL8_9FLAO|nr:acyl-CoA thioesterase [Zhouia amylolytica]SFS57348.1 acyl-CoA thioester hydrolase [Zhouia amylolytica]
MNKLPVTLESQTKIRFQDCDPFNHLNNGRYIDYFLNAREDQLLKYYNIDIFKIIREDKLGWVVSSSQLAYLKPVFTMEDIIITTELIRYSNKDLTVEAKMWNKDKTILKSLAWMNFVHFNLTSNQVNVHSETFMKLFKEVVSPIKENTFEERHLNFRLQKVN